MAVKSLIHIGLLWILLSNRPETIADLSFLTRTQFETLELHRTVRKSKIDMEASLKTRRNSKLAKVGISKGTHYRIVAQARRNIKRSLFTVALAVQLGLLKPEDVQKLVSMVSAVPRDADPERLVEFVALAEVLANRIVMF